MEEDETPTPTAAWRESYKQAVLNRPASQGSGFATHCGLLAISALATDLDRQQNEL